MASAIEFSIPKGMMVDDVAECFTAYLLGRVWFLHARKQHRPDESPSRIQLGGSNGYWLRMAEADTAWLMWCDAVQRKVAHAMVTLFEARYGERVLSVAS